MRKLTEKEVARLLAARATPEPPPGLADRIKAEIPGSIRIDRQTLRPGRRWLLPPLVEGMQPSWLAAASVLLVLGVGIVAARIPVQPDDVWKWMALSGVVYIDDVVVTAPEPRESERTLVAAAPAPAAKAARQKAVALARGETGRLQSADASIERRDEAARPAGPAVGGTAAGVEVPAPAAGSLEVNVSDGREALPGATVTATRADARDVGTRASVSDAGGRAVLSYLPPGEYRVRSELQGFEPLDATVKVAAGARSRVELTMPQSKVAEEVTVSGSYETVQTSAQTATRIGRAAPARAAAAAAATPERERGVTVVVLDQDGEPVPDATVTLERIGQAAMWTRTARTEADGTATFPGVPPSTYRALVAAPSLAPAQLVVGVTSERTPTRAEIRLRPAQRR